jgi:cysteinyl-tRNA synthetase
VGDFVLWKKWTEADGAVGWDSPWGKGRPGWHIECSALSMECLGEEIDIHGGGTDLRFPHHENEIAQSEAATGRRFVRHWFHVEHLLVDGQKMSKSLGNMYTVRQVLERGYTGRELRYALISGAAYAKNLNFTWQGMEDAKTALARIDEWRKRIKEAAAKASVEEKALASPSMAGAISIALANDLNINEALGILFTWIRNSNKDLDKVKEGELSRISAVAFDKAWNALDAVLGLGDVVVEIPADVQTLLDDRVAARKERDFAKSDELRKAIERLGWKVKDTAKGQELTKA